MRFKWELSHQSDVEIIFCGVSFERKKTKGKMEKQIFFLFMQVNKHEENVKSERLFN